MSARWPTNRSAHYASTSARQSSPAGGCFAFTTRRPTLPRTLRANGLGIRCARLSTNNIQDRRARCRRPVCRGVCRRACAPAADPAGPCRSVGEARCQPRAACGRTQSHRLAIRFRPLLGAVPGARPLPTFAAPRPWHQSNTSANLTGVRLLIKPTSSERYLFASACFLTISFCTSMEGPSPADPPRPIERWASPC